MATRAWAGAAVAAGLMAFGPIGHAGDEGKQHAAGASAHHVLVTPDQVKWSPGPASLPKGAQVVVITGDMHKPGPFTARLKFPENYRIPPHFHPADENVTVLSGTLMMGQGDTFDAAKMQALPAGGYAMMPKGSHHFVMTKGGATIQLHAIGPWGITYVNQADDPRSGSAPKAK